MIFSVENLKQNSYCTPMKTQNSHDLHVPVMMNEIISNLSSCLLDASTDLELNNTGIDTSKNPKKYLDGTLGRGGHLQAILNQFPHVTALALDQDMTAIQYANEKFQTEISTGRLKIAHLNFSNYTQELFGEFDGMLLDLGVSSPQLDQAERGFSFYHDGPLDMRMNQSQTRTAADVIAEFSEQELIDIFKTYGEIQRPFRVVRAIINDRQERPFTRTKELAGLIERVDGWYRKGFHPATQYFMALRLVVNQELEILEPSLIKLVHGLKPKGRIAVLTFHSLEDRIVKNTFKSLTDVGFPVNKKVIVPEREEEVRNPRSRSAKLRVFEKY